MEASLIAELLRQSIEEGKSPYLNVISDSMSPLIRRGDQVQLAPATPDKLQKGDVIVIHGDDEIITHRFWGLITGPGLEQILTKGDRPQHFDPPRDADTLIGMVTGRRRLGRFMEFSQGAGRILNALLTRLAGLDIRLFTPAPKIDQGTEAQAAYDSGMFASTTSNNTVHLLLRRSIHAAAKGMVFVAQLFDKRMEEG